MVIQSTRKRLVIAALVAFALAYAVNAAAQMKPSMCNGLTSSDWEWWIRQCYLYSFTESDRKPFHGFIVR